MEQRRTKEIISADEVGELEEVLPELRQTPEEDEFSNINE